MFKRSMFIGFSLLPLLASAQDDEITLSHIKYCYNLWGSAAICESKSAWVTENEMVRFRQLCDLMIQEKYGYSSDSVTHMKRQAARDGASETFNSTSELFEMRCRLTKSLIVDLLSKSGMK